MMSIGDFTFSTFSDDEISCACIGICNPPLPPNPDAVAWFQSFTKTRAQADLPQAIKDNAAYIALTAIIVAVGLFGKRKLRFELNKRTLTFSIALIRQWYFFRQRYGLLFGCGLATSQHHQHLYGKPMCVWFHYRGFWTYSSSKLNSNNLISPSVVVDYY